MPTIVNGFDLNDVSEPPDWSPRERTAWEGVVVQCAPYGTTLVNDEHHHDKVMSPDETVEVIVTNNAGLTTLAGGLTINGTGFFPNDLLLGFGNTPAAPYAFIEWDTSRATDSLVLDTSSNLVIQLGDAAGANQLQIEDSGGNVVGRWNSDGAITIATEQGLSQQTTVSGALTQLVLQSTTTNARSGLAIVPNGINTLADLRLFSTSDYSTNFENVVFGYDSGNATFLLATDKGGTGTVRPLYIDATGSATPATSNMYFTTSGNCCLVDDHQLGFGNTAAAPDVTMEVDGGTEFQVRSSLGFDVSCSAGNLELDVDCGTVLIDSNSSSTTINAYTNLTLQSDTGDVLINAANNGDVLISVKDYCNVTLGDAAGTSKFQIKDNGSNVVGTWDSNGSMWIGTGSTIAFGDISNATIGYNSLLSAIETITSGCFDVKLGDNAGVYSFRINDSDGNGKSVINSDGEAYFNTVGIGVEQAYDLHLGNDSAAKPSTNTWTVPSDERIKKNVIDFRKYGLKDLLALRPVEYQFNGLAGIKDDGKNHIGYIAQEVEKVIPEMIKTFEAKLYESDKEKTVLKNTNPHIIPFAIIEALREINNRLEVIENR